MTEYWLKLLYPLGFLSSIAFTARFLLQWLQSEKQKKSVVTPVFWKLSLAGNILLLLHSFIQVQIHVCLIQICNAVISWRNLNIMQPPSKQWQLRWVIALLFSSLATVIVGFAARFGFDNVSDWFRIPAIPWLNNPQDSVSTLWHAVGTLGLLLFNSRFWIQWWGTEKSRKSYLGPAFWWISLTGDILCLMYFVQIRDIVNLIGPLFGLVPYVRNIMIIRKSAQHNPTESSP